jgi:formylglycine-generating enzyme required for sulfatase activity
MLGNIAEWVEDCYVEDLRELPKDGSAATQGDCTRRVVRGGTWGNTVARLRAANRTVIEPKHRDNYYGVRIVRSP